MIIGGWKWLETVLLNASVMPNILFSTKLEILFQALEI